MASELSKPCVLRLYCAVESRICLVYYNWHMQIFIEALIVVILIFHYRNWKQVQEKLKFQILTPTKGRNVKQVYFFFL